MFVKVCGLKTVEEIHTAIELGYNAFGVMLTKESKRCIAKKKALSLVQAAKGKIKSVAVSMNYGEIEDVADRFDYVQLYEYKSLKNLIFASNLQPDNSINPSFFLYDKSKGSGEFHTPPEWLKSLRQKFIIAGGLNPENVRQVIKNYSPDGIDVSSGVEINGKKEFNLMKKFIIEAKNE